MRKALEIELAETHAKASQPTGGILFCLVRDFTGSLAEEQARRALCTLVSRATSVLMS